MSKTLYMANWEKRILNLLKGIPFTYIGMVQNMFPSNTKTILDMGCGNGEFMSVISKNRKYNISGVEIFPDYIKHAKKLNIYNKIYKSDLSKFKPRNRYDVIFLSHVIEHLTKSEADKLLNKIEKYTGERIVVITPNGKYEQKEYDGNAHQKHKSEWTPKDFKIRGYKVLGQGWRFLYKSKLLKNLGVFYYLLYVFSTLTQPILNQFPNASLQLICYKEIR